MLDEDRFHLENILIHEFGPSRLHPLRTHSVAALLTRSPATALTPCAPCAGHSIMDIGLEGQPAFDDITVRSYITVLIT